MDVNTEIARALGLTSEYDGTTYVFCGKGCKLEFDEDPARFFEPEYQPRM
jgi:YHS domain-containing protein